MAKFSKKILLLSPVPPCSNYSGGLVLEHLSYFLPKGSLVCFSLLHKDLSPEIPNKLKWIPIKYHEKPNEGWPNLPFGIGPLLSFLGETYVKYFILPKILQEIILFGKKHKVDCLWVVLEGQNTIRLGLKAAKQLKIPVFSEVWDPPEWANRNNHLDKINRAISMRQFGRLVSKSKRLACAGPAMAERYRKKYGVKSVAFLPSLPKKMAFPPSKVLNQSKELIIAVCGQLYSKEEWRAFLSALGVLNWQIDGRKIKMRLLGNWVGLDKVYEKMNIEYFGWYNQKETVEMMRQADILYCPYYFDKTYRQVAELSFPSKLATYLAAGRPVFFHGPVFSSPGKFLEQNEAALICKSMETNQIIVDLKRLVRDRSLYQSLAAKGRVAFDKFLTRDVLHAKFAEFLAVPETELIPLKEESD